MIQIAFCDDDQTVLDQLSALLEKYRAQRCVQIQCTAFHSPLDLLAEIEKGTRYDILFLDVIMPAENGITVSNGATLTFKDSVGGGVFKHTATRPEKSAILANDSGTVVNIESGTIEATKGNGLKVNDAAFHVSGGTIIGGEKE